MKVVLTKENILTYIKNFVLIVLGTGVLAFGTAIFLVPFDLVTGGVSGLAIVLNNAFSNIFPDASVDFYITVLTWVLFFLGLIFLGKNFAFKTLLSTIFYPILFTLSYNLVEYQSFNGLFVLQNTTYQDIAVLLAALFGGALVGAGCAITFIVGGSTGGVDVLAFLVCKVFKNLKSSHVIFAIDALVVILGIFVIEDIVLSLLGICSAFVCAAVIDRVFLGNSTAYLAQIVTNREDEICKGVIEELDRTATIIEATGAYSKQSKKIVLVSFSIREYGDLMNIINKADPTAFMTISRAHENHGEGWTHEKT